MKETLLLSLDQVLQNIRNFDYLICPPLLPFSYIILKILRDILFEDLGWGHFIDSPYDLDKHS